MPPKKQPQKPPQTPLMAEGLDDEMLQDIFGSDQAMYPAPLTLDRLRSWADAAPELALCFWFTAVRSEWMSWPLAGTIIALPVLSSFWRDLLVGKLKETDIDPATMFPGESDQGAEVGLHVFHIERTDEPQTEMRLPGFGKFAMNSAVEAAAEKEWKVIGQSALTATPDGKRFFEKIGFVPTGYEEYWIDSGSSPGVQLVTVSAETASETKIPEESTIKGHARMMATTKHLLPADVA
ncbi:hypothetical protein CKAH01_04462 [Colletotrichum kahawae]|uniref:Uncharacterized protein n=1 Tax=Colletotrichum kahawae TaxID=34407 RepID=A0AAD9YL59_COLKA|nr:hypothetical protein CKAH01_04462 [Colletotrichum kahawae]